MKELRFEKSVGGILVWVKCEGGNSYGVSEKVCRDNQDAFFNGSINNTVIYGGRVHK